MVDEVFKISSIQSVNPTLSKTMPAAVTDDELVTLVLAGDDAAFAEIFERYKRLVVHLVGKFFQRREEVEDITQQSFTKIFVSLKAFRGGNEKSFASWLSRLTVNACYDELRRRGRRPENLFSEFSDDEREHFEKIVAGDGASAENRTISRDLAAKILAQLDPKERLALTLLHGEDFSVAEVAKIVGWSESNVKTRLFRCRNNLRSIFGHFFNI